MMGKKIFLWSGIIIGFLFMLFPSLFLINKFKEFWYGKKEDVKVKKEFPISLIKETGEQKKTEESPFSKIPPKDVKSEKKPPPQTSQKNITKKSIPPDRSPKTNISNISKTERKKVVEKKTGRLIKTNFQYENKEAVNVFIAGSFSNWDAKKGGMKKIEEGIWEIFIPLSKGKHLYKFKVDGKWILDPMNPLTAEDSKGGQCSLIIIR